ncbi:hypothetical protein GQX73_g858 [Xylaria multiplex]|uniref:Uncharacterized protein n=1 Tax=Xylaria multiplex TaxID=323545 RepID=A0A7C8IUM9_9PEZI|nr:hypothetical protein GQX73_g858 [Xylaria multiplex]
MTHNTIDETLEELSLPGSQAIIVQEQTIEDPTFDLPWYQWWMLEQIHKQPERLLQILPAYRSYKDSTAAIRILWGQIRRAITTSGQCSIESITDMLISQQLVNIEDSYEALLSVKDLVFCIIGLQTMLYQPCFDIGIPGGYRILDEMNGYQGSTRMSLYQSSNSSARDLPEFLLGFGMMLPPPNYCPSDNDAERHIFNQIKTVTPNDIDAHVLSRLCGLKFQWIDSLSCHLELDKHSSTLFLYRYPSFCISNLQQHELRNIKDGRKTALYSCASGANGTLRWANEEDITGLLREILLSYRVIFGQNKRSRTVFRKLRPFTSISNRGHDQNLAELCGKKRFNCSLTLVEQEEYDLAVDFPHLRSRIALLAGYASSKQPHSLRRLWHDRRNSPTWLAYWSALVFGFMGLLLVLIQTVFQILQYVDQVRDDHN